MRPPYPAPEPPTPPPAPGRPRPRLDLSSPSPFYGLSHRIAVLIEREGASIEEAISALMVIKTRLEYERAMRRREHAPCNKSEACHG